MTRALASAHAHPRLLRQGAHGCQCKTGPSPCGADLLPVGGGTAGLEDLPRRGDARKVRCRAAVVSKSGGHSGWTVVDKPGSFTRQ